jgi:hypothetical protein
MRREDSMRSFKTAKIAVGALALSVILPGLAAAKDFCITVNDSTYVLIGKNFVAPMKGKCKPWTGLVTQLGIDSPSAGTACVASDGSDLNLTITTIEAGAVFFDSVTLALPSKTGTDIFTELSGGGGNSYAAVGVQCNPVAIPTVSADAESALTAGSEKGPGTPR